MQAIKNIGLMTVLKIIASLSGLLYSVLQVNYFGTSPEVEAYFAAASLMYLVISLTQAGQLAEIFLPVYNTIKAEKGKEAGHTVFSIVINSMSLYLFIGLAVMFVGKDLLIRLIAPGFNEEQQTIATIIFVSFLPLIFFQVITSFISTWFNAEGKFGRVELLSIINSIVSVLLLIAFHTSLGVWVLVVSLFIGKIVEILAYAIMMHHYGYRHKWVLKIAYFDRVLFFKNMMTTMGYVLSTQFYNIAITSCATLLPQGTYAIFSYAQQLYIKATGFLVQPIQTYFFSRYSQLLSANAQAEILVPKAIRLYLAIYVLIISLVFWSGYDMLSIIWRKDANHELLVLGSGYLIANFATLIFSSIGGVYRKIAISHGEIKSLYLVWIVCQIISAASIYILTAIWSTQGLTFAILFNLGLLNVSSIAVVHIKGLINKITELKPILINYCLLFVVTFCSAGLIYSYIQEWDFNIVLSKYLNLILKMTCFSFVVFLLYLCALRLTGELKLLLNKRN